MKRVTMIGMLFLLLVALVGCGQFNEEQEITGERVIDILDFPSLEAFLDAYLIVREDGEGDISDFVSEFWSATGDDNLMDIATGAEFASLEMLHLPVGIPEDFELYRVRINELLVSFRFLHRDDMVSEYATKEADLQQQFFEFHFHRIDAEDSVLLEGILEQDSATKADLIDGRYLFREPNSFTWVSNRTIFGLRTPVPQYDTSSESIMAATELGGVSLDDPYAMVSFTETVTINLQDTRAVEAMIEELAAQ